MEEKLQRDLTTLLGDWSRGDLGARDELIERVYDELRRMAAGRMREEGAHTLQATAVVHEVFLRLAEQRHIEWRSRAQLFYLAGRMMHRVLVDHARGRRSAKRGGGMDIRSLDALPPCAAAEAPGAEPIEVTLALEQALRDLAALDARRAQVVELHFLAGFSLAETATLLGCSEATVSRDWKLARVWLARRLGSPEPEEAGPAGASGGA